eukprot:3170200-Prymnesium_polylepis.1
MEAREEVAVAADAAAAGGAAAAAAAVLAAFAAVVVVGTMEVGRAAAGATSRPMCMKSSGERSSTLRSNVQNSLANLERPAGARFECGDGAAGKGRGAMWRLRPQRQDGGCGCR